MGAMQRALLVSGTRGVGKTVLLNEFEESARRLGCVVIRAYADAQMVAQLRNSTIPEAIEELDYTEKTGRKITGFSVAGVGSVTTQLPHNQAQPSLVSRLRSLLKAARAHDAGVLLTVDEVQAASVGELAQLATAIQDLIRDEYDIAFAAAGLTFGVEELLEHEGTTFLRRAQRLELGLLDDATVAETLHSTATAAGRGFSERALEEATALVQGYPYLLQLVGALAWTHAVLDGARDSSAYGQPGAQDCVEECSGRPARFSQRHGGAGSRTRT
ncbi:ATP-binding protein [uncultured Corynebacterium sp.]|uniref:ATP-binding protein n=1 Tax=uncultured Corynebacterium sp. TaxID=159447 RepID=UPI0025FE0E69|nr:ATP-binding protein [uncultured Corynebacterium sp.]